MELYVKVSFVLNVLSLLIYFVLLCRGEYYIEAKTGLLLFFASAWSVWSGYLLMRG
jgi:hypothetical protein